MGINWRPQGKQIPFLRPFSRENGILGALHMYLHNCAPTMHFYSIQKSIRVHLSPGSSCGLVAYASARRCYVYWHISSWWNA